MNSRNGWEVWMVCFYCVNCFVVQIFFLSALKTKVGLVD